MCAGDPAGLEYRVDQSPLLTTDILMTETEEGQRGMFVCVVGWGVRGISVLMMFVHV